MYVYIYVSSLPHRNFEKRDYVVIYFQTGSTLLYKANSARCAGWVYSTRLDYFVDVAHTSRSSRVNYSILEEQKVVSLAR